MPRANQRSSRGSKGQQFKVQRLLTTNPVKPPAVSLSKRFNCAPTLGRPAQGIDSALKDCINGVAWRLSARFSALKWALLETTDAARQPIRVRFKPFKPFKQFNRFALFKTLRIQPILKVRCKREPLPTRVGFKSFKPPAVSLSNGSIAALRSKRLVPLRGRPGRTRLSRVESRDPAAGVRVNHGSCHSF